MSGPKETIRPIKIIREDTDPFVRESFVDIMSPEDGMRYEWIEFKDAELEDIPEKYREKAKRKGILGIVKMDVMSRADKTTRNGTIYPLEYLKREVEKLQAKIQNRSCYMAANHPGWDDRYRVHFGNNAAYLSDLSMDESTGVVSGEAIVIDKPSGQDVASTFRAGGFVGNSSRARASAEKGEIDGIYGVQSGLVMQSDLSMEGWDFVLDPSVPDASISGMTEETKHGEPIMNRKELQEKYPEVYESIQEEGRTKALEELTKEDSAYVKRESFDALKAEMEEIREGRSLLATDLTETKVLLQDKETALEDKDTKIQELESKVQEHEEAVKVAQVESTISEMLANHPHAEKIKDRLSESDKQDVETVTAKLESEIAFLADVTGAPAAPYTPKPKGTNPDPNQTEDDKKDDYSSEDAEIQLLIQAGRI